MPPTIPAMTITFMINIVTYARTATPSLAGTFDAHTAQYIAVGKVAMFAGLPGVVGRDPLGDGLFFRNN
jgi:hypothetical protein